MAFDPRGVSGFFCHSQMLAIVHLLTLGWITASIRGSLFGTAEERRSASALRARPEFADDVHADRTGQVDSGMLQPVASTARRRIPRAGRDKMTR